MVGVIIKVGDKNHLWALFQILIILISIFSFNYFAHANESMVRILSADENERKILTGALVRDFLLENLDILPSVSAQAGTGSPFEDIAGDILDGIEQPLSGFTTQEQCCLQTNNGAICQEITSNLIGQVCDSENIVPTECNQVAECKLGCCIDLVEGLCSERSTKEACEINGGEWRDDENCNILECRNNCCVLGSEAVYTTEQRCVQLSGSLGFEIDYRQVESELECLVLAEEVGEGACKIDGGCRFGTAQECLAIRGQFFEGFLCSHPDIGSGCERQASISCIDQKDGIYWIDSCGNRENVYNSDRDASWNEGKVLRDIESCNYGQSNSGSTACGNCNYLAGSICSETDPGKGVQDGDFICEDLSCDASKETGGKRRENGESWCVYDSYIGDGKDTVGSRHWKRVCVEGQVEVEPCGDYRTGLCVESEASEGGKSFSVAQCVPNRANECMSYNNEEEEARAKKCQDNSHCILTEVDVDDDFQFDICTGKYPLGFDLSGEEGRGKDTATSLCAQATMTCTAVYVKKINLDWECEANCECESEKFAEELNNLCISLGDCGSYINYAGKGTDNIVVEGADAVSWQDYVQYAIPVPGQKVDPDSLEELIRRGMVRIISFGGEEYEPGEGGLGGFVTVIGATGVAAKAASVLVFTGLRAAYGASAGSLLKVGWSATKTVARQGALGFAAKNNIVATYILPGLQVLGYAAIGAFLGALAGQLISSLFGLQGDAAMALAITGAVGGAIVGASYGLSVVLDVGGAVGVCGPAILICIIFLILVLIVLAIVFKLLGIGEVEEREVSFECLPWQPPVGATDCRKCNEDPSKPCTPYRCQALGAACEIANVETENPLCVSKINDGSPPNIFPQEIQEGFRFQSINSGEVILQNSGITGNAINSDVSCTQVIGFSQTEGWYNAGFENYIDDEKWQLLWQSGASIDLWASSSFSGWNANIISKCSENSGVPDRIILTISGEFNSNVQWWADEIQKTISVINEKYPSVEQIILQPVVGGPQGELCNFGGEQVRASSNHPVIDQAIAQVANGDDILIGASPEVDNCNQYKDSIGHLTNSGYSSVAQKIAQFYQSSTDSTNNTDSESSSSNNGIFSNIGFASEGVAIRTESGECLPEFTPVVFVLGTDEEAQCKYDFLVKGYEELGRFPAEGTYYTENHTFVITMPSLGSLQDLGIPITGDVREMMANLNMHVKCQDVYGNINNRGYDVNTCVVSGPDITPPRILGASPANGGFLPINTSEVKMTLFINEPANCKIDSDGGKEYDNMQKDMNCNTDLIQGGNFGWMCDTTLNNLEDDSEYFIRCKDQPWLSGSNESDRNSNNQDYIYSLQLTENALEISSIYPEDEIVAGVNPVTVELEITTSGGINNGNAICMYSFANEDANIGFFESGRTSHRQIFNLNSGNYKIYLKCIDDAGNIAKDIAEFRVRLDTRPPEVTRVYNQGGNLNIVTDEKAECFYNFDRCNLPLENATSMTTVFSTQHSADWEQGRIYFIKCQDVFQNRPNECTIQVVASSAL
jgi:hypothetical protein